MKVFIKNKLVSMGGSSEVLDENQNQIFKVKGKIFSWTRKKTILDMNGNKLYVIKNKFWHMFSYKVFIKDVNGDKVATIQKWKNNTNNDYEILDTIDDMKLEGRYFSGVSQIIRNGEQVGTITRNFTIMTDSFTLEADEKDIPFFTALVVALDNLTDKKRKD